MHSHTRTRIPHPTVSVFPSAYQKNSAYRQSSMCDRQSWHG